jgi:ABC-2 type transport system permease protein
MNLPRSILNAATLIRKNLKVLIRAKASALIVILSPLLIILLAGIAFDNTNVYSVNIGTFSPQYNDLSTSFVEQLAQNQFRVARYPSEPACSDALRQGEVHICVVFSRDFTIGRNGSNEMTFYVDNSRLNLVWTVLNVMTARIAERLTQLSHNLTTVLLNAIDVTQREVSNERKAVTALTTQNDAISKKVALLTERYASISSSLEGQDFNIDDLQTKKTIVGQWVDNAHTLADEAIAKARSFASEAYDVIGKSSIPAGEKQNLTAKLNATSAKIDEFNTRTASSRELGKGQFDEMAALLDELVSALSSIRSQLSETSTLSTTESAALSSSAESALKAIFDIQRSLDAIASAIDAITIRESAAIVQPVVTTVKPVAAQRTYLNYIFPILMALVVMFTAVLLSPTLILLEKNAPSAFRNFMLPVKESTYVIAIFLTSLGVLILQSVIIIAIAAIFFGAVVLSALPTTLLTMLLLSMLFAFLGMVIGYLFASEETATLAAVFSGSALLFLSDVIIPIESMPPILLSAAHYNPFVLGGSILRKTILLGVPLGDIWLDVLILAAEMSLLGVAAFIAALRSRRTALSRYFKRQASPPEKAVQAKDAKVAREVAREQQKPPRKIELRDS